MKNEKYLENDYKTIISNYGLQEKVLKINSLTKFVKDGLIIGHWGLDKSIQKSNTKKGLAIITGFSLSGRIHISNKPVLDVAKSLSKLGGEIFIPISDTEAILTREKSGNLEQDFDLFKEDIFKIGVNPERTNIYLHSNNKKVLSLSLKIVKNLKIEDFRKFYGKNIDLPEILAISNMLADVFYPIDEGYNRVIVVLGIDEIRHAQLIKFVSRKLKFKAPDFLFIRIFMGLKGAKMSKSKPWENILVCDKPEKAKNKLIENSKRRKFKDIHDEVPYQIARWTLNIPEEDINILLSRLTYREFVIYISNKLESYFNNEFR